MFDLRRELVLDVRGVSSRFLVSEVTVRKWFRKGCPFFKVGGSVRTTLEAVQRWAGMDAVPEQQQSVDADDAMRRLAAAGYSVR
jgi:hypothetical protein